MRIILKHGLQCMRLVMPTVISCATLVYLVTPIRCCVGICSFIYWIVMMMYDNCVLLSLSLVLRSRAYLGFFFQIKFPTLIPAHRYFLSPLLQVEFSFPLILLDERNSTFITISIARPLLLPGASWWVLRLLHSAIFHYTSLGSYSHIQGRGRYATI